MTSDDRDELGRLFATLEEAPGFRIERYLTLVRAIGTIFLDNATELEAALLAFRAPQAGALIAIDKRAELDRFLLLATRRLYNYLATACSTVEHTKAVTRRLPDDLAELRKDLLVGDVPSAVEIQRRLM
jgi:hypothetical protein